MHYAVILAIQVDFTIKIDAEHILNNSHSTNRSFCVGGGVPVELNTTKHKKYWYLNSLNIKINI